MKELLARIPTTSSNWLRSRFIFVVILIMIGTIIVDTSIVKVSLFTGGPSSSSYDIAAFTAMAAIFSVGQYLVLRFVRTISDQNSNEKLRLGRTYKYVSAIQYVLTGTLAFLIVQMILRSSYNVLLVELAICLSYVLALILLGLFLYRLLLWLKTNIKPVVLAYSLSIAMIWINAVFTLLYVSNELNDGTGRIFGAANIQPGMMFVGFYTERYDIFNAGYILSSIVSFTLTWAATVLLLRNYSKKLGTVRYWIVVTLPLLYFLSQFGYIFLELFASFRVSHPVLFGIVYTLFFSGTVPAGGVLFGIAFWSIAHNIRNNAVKQYMTVSAYGMILIFSSNQPSSLVHFFYPPFGLIALSFFALGSYLILVGIYSAVISVAQDSDLRKSIKQSASSDTEILNVIGSSEMENEIRKRINVITKNLATKSDEISKQTGVSSSLEEEEIREYLEEVVEELKKTKQTS